MQLQPSMQGIGNRFGLLLSYSLAIYGTDSIDAQPMPWQAQHKRIQLLRAELLMPVNARRRPYKPALVDAARDKVQKP